MCANYRAAIVADESHNESQAKSITRADCGADGEPEKKAEESNLTNCVSGREREREK